MAYKGFIFDVNGTMIDDMRFHISSWHNILNNLGANLTIEEVQQQCYGKNHELLERVFPGKFTYEERDRMSMDKEKAYQETFRPHLKLVNGLPDFLRKAQEQSIMMSVASAAIMFNIDYVLDGMNIRHYFECIVSADDVAVSKPHPECFLKAAEGMQLSPADCLVFEDTPKGVETALNAGMDAVVIMTLHTQEEFAHLPNIIRFSKDFSGLHDLLEV